METPVFWKRPDLQFPTFFDTILFDVDGVLIKTIDSFHATDIATAEYVAGTIHGLDWGQNEGKTVVTTTTGICVIYWQPSAQPDYVNGKAHHWRSAVSKNGLRFHEPRMRRGMVVSNGSKRSCLPLRYLITT